MFIAALVLTVAAAVVPTTIYVSIAWWLDRYEKEPWWLLGLTFLWGAVPAIIFALMAEILLDIPIRAIVTGEGAAIVSAVVVAPVAEELFKAIPLLAIFIIHPREFDGLMDGLLYGALVGFGFAMTENVFYYAGAFTDGGLGDFAVVVFLRAVIFGLNHALFSSMFGLGLGFARYAGNAVVRWMAPLVGLLLAILLHGIHNFFVSVESTLFVISLGSDWLGVLLWLMLVYLAGRQEARWIRQELANEVRDGLLTPGQAHAAARYRSRVRARIAALQEYGFGYAHRLGRLYSLAAELAFRKRQLRIEGNSHDTVDVVRRLRNEIRRLRHDL